MFKIRKFLKKDTENTALLMVKVYKKFNQSEATKKGLQEYVNSIHPKKVPLNKLYKKLNKPIAFVATDREKIIGIVRGTPDRINSLFVDEQYQKQGVGKKLVEFFVSAAKKRGAKFIKVRSSVFAVPFYKAMGFKKNYRAKETSWYENVQYEACSKRNIVKLPSFWAHVRLISRNWYEGRTTLKSALPKGSGPAHSYFDSKIKVQGPSFTK